jgi:hypothetical protein
MSGYAEAAFVGGESGIADAAFLPKPFIACRHGLQWIIQRPGSCRRGTARWRGFRYCTTRRGLERFGSSQGLDEAITSAQN